MTMSPIGVARADNFDESLRAPPIASGAELKTMAARIAFRVGVDAPSSAVHDASLQREWVALRRRLMSAIDHGVPLSELQATGVVAHSDGSYSIDYGKSPHWWPLDSRMEVFLTPAGLDHLASPLKKRGFRDSDIETLRKYLRGSRWRASALSRNRTLAQSFDQRLRVRAATQRTDKPAIDRWEVEAFLHQRGRIEDEARREWAAGLLAALDRQRQRILESYLMEQTGTALIRPENPETIAKMWKERLANNEVVSALDVAAREVKP